MWRLATCSIPCACVRFKPSFLPVACLILPTAHGAPQINLNTAPAELIAAALDIDLGQARQLVDRRETKVYGDLKQFGGDIVPPVATLDGNVLSVNSRFFIVRGLIRLGRVESFSETLLERESNKRVTVIWQRRL